MTKVVDIRTFSAETWSVVVTPCFEEVEYLSGSPSFCAEPSLDLSGFNLLLVSLHWMKVLAKIDASCEYKLASTTAFPSILVYLICGSDGASKINYIYEQPTVWSRLPLKYCLSCSKIKIDAAFLHLWWKLSVLLLRILPRRMFKRK